MDDLTIFQQRTKVMNVMLSSSWQAILKNALKSQPLYQTALVLEGKFH